LTLKQGTSAIVTMRITDRRDYDPQRFTFHAETDRGPLLNQAVIRLMPRHNVVPDSFTIYAPASGDAHPVEFVHRAIFSRGKPYRRPTVHASKDFVVTKVDSQRGEVESLPGSLYEDTKYRLTLKSSAVGTFRDEIRLATDDQEKLVEVPIVWRRLPFVSSLPDRVALGSRTSRVFLQCPDEAVELTAPLSVPVGVKAVLASPRELAVTLADNAPPIIDGVIEVGTTAKDGNPLRIPVIRYSSRAEVK
jgi:hypothetical protein